MTVLGQPDPRACVQSHVDAVCVRGVFGCQLDHDGPPVVAVSGLETCLSTSGRLLDGEPDWRGMTL